MKKFIQIIGVLALALVTVFACKKSGEEVKKEERFSIAMKVAAANGNTENAIIIGSKTELKTALSEKYVPIYVKKVSASNNVFIPIVGEPVLPNPNKLCWDEIDAYVNAHKAEWQQQANQTCSTVLVCVTCPNTGGGLYVLYVIKPTSPKCTIYEAFEMQFNISAFNFTNNQLESEAVASFIKGR
ncbi:hypothetical protein [Pedobacter montanisoli]|uniref:Lipoprotein n=1 Tax=Pedobacter montanisoli TaxID=2923277 RepID=A0ABS9ZSW7_9SPHI|nr:hypothetical protein [Pedobacter montanisoli]MCJ0741677.1 hypothetical protein [Pedobacter montanisoli]